MHPPNLIFGSVDASADPRKTIPHADCPLTVHTYLIGWRVLTAFWVTFNFCHADSILLVHLHHKRDVPSLMTFGGKLLVPRPMQFYKGIPQ